MKKGQASPVFGGVCSKKLNGAESAASMVRGLMTTVVVALVVLFFCSMILPVSPRWSQTWHFKNIRAKIEIRDLSTAIEAYYLAYGRFPVSTNIQQYAARNNRDVTYGGIREDKGGTRFAIPPIPTGPLLKNSEIIAALMDWTNFPTVNADHQLNPQQTKFLNARLVDDCESPGVGKDLVYRDPWGNPYIITLNLKGDKQCEDAFYRQQAVSQESGATGYGGLFNSVDTNGNGSHFACHGQVMVWSLGPDRQADGTKPAIAKPNADNILSWQ